jgi:hypothetical protein
MKLKEQEFFFLVAGLLITLLIAPVTIGAFPGVFQLALIATLLVAVWSMVDSRRLYLCGWVLVVLMILTSVLGVATEFAWAYLLNFVVLILFCFTATAYALSRVLLSETVDGNRLAGAVSVYMLFGLMWALVYFFIYLVDPQAFKGVPAIESFQPDVLEAVMLDLLYYSYVTLSTLGYGDISPVSRVAQALAYLEAITGVLYVAVLVAALVGAYQGRAKASNAADVR